MLLARKLLAETVAAGGGGWDLSTASYDNIAFWPSISSPINVFFKPDGTKFYTYGEGESLVQHSLSTAWDLSTASKENTLEGFFEGNNPRGFTFKPDGLKLYSTSYSSSSLYQYSLSVAWDISTLSYDGVLTSIVSSPFGVAFKDDGTKVYVIGIDNDTVNQYSLSVAWDISTLSDDGVSINTGAEETLPVAITFKPDGTKMYISGFDTNHIYQYGLSTAWDLSTASYDNVSFNGAGQTINCMGVAFKPDGTKMYPLNSNDEELYQYSLS